MVNRTNICASCPVGEDWFGEQTRTLPTIRKLEIHPCLLLHFAAKSFFVSQFCLASSCLSNQSKDLDRDRQRCQRHPAALHLRLQQQSALPLTFLQSCRPSVLELGWRFGIWELGFGIQYLVFEMLVFCISCSSSWLLLHMAAN